MSRENCFLKNELEKVQRERDHFRDMHERVNGETKNLHQTMRAVELDKQDLQTAYQEVCAENEKLRDANARLVDDNKHLFGRSS